MAYQHQLEAIAEQINSRLIGKPEVVRLAICCLLAGGHLLLEDLPGVGKTSLAKWLAESFGLSFRRVQFTSDLLPADIVGLSVFESDKQAFRFHPGPIFNQLVLADELNRASPRTQSALLEAMEERQVSVDGVSRPLDAPFFVIATQNPHEQLGTFALPESQLDRFGMRLTIGFPDVEAELRMLKGAGDNAPAPLHLLSAPELFDLQRLSQRLYASDAVLRYLLALVHHSRQRPDAKPLSPRASKMLLACARAWAFLEGRDHVIPEDVQQVFTAVAGHRLATGDAGINHAVALLQAIDPFGELA
jgi:MoxR-like ATPase